MNANLLFAWRRLQRRGLLESRWHAPPLLPVTITEPTITPTQRTLIGTRSRRARPVPGDSSAPAQVEIMIGEPVRVRLYAEARSGIGAWLAFYNDERLHQALAYKTLRENLCGQHACGYHGQRQRVTHIVTGTSPIARKELTADRKKDEN